MLIRCKPLRTTSRLPLYATAGAAAADLFADLAEPMHIERGCRALVPSGLAMEIPVGWEVQLRPRSGLAFKHGITVLNSPATIDSDYRGEVGIVVVNHGDDRFTIEPGERIAQMVLARAVQATFMQVEALSSTARDGGGFGSTGRR